MFSQSKHPSSPPYFWRFHQTPLVKWTELHCCWLLLKFNWIELLLPVDCWTSLLLIVELKLSIDYWVMLNCWVEPHCWIFLLLSTIELNLTLTWTLLLSAELNIDLKIAMNLVNKLIWKKHSFLNYNMNRNWVNWVN